jgi:hypothetical protein
MADMADVYIVTLSILGILITFPGLAAAMTLLLPGATEVAYTRLAQTPVKAFVLGLPVTAFITFWVVLLASLNASVLKGIAFILALVALGIDALGAAGLSRLLGERIGAWTGTGSPLSNLIRGAVIYELACLFPLVGWLLFAPVAWITTMGAAIFALLRWLPKPRPTSQDAESTMISDSTATLDRLSNV